MAVNGLANCDRQKRFSQNERRMADLQKGASDFLFLPKDLGAVANYRHFFSNERCSFFFLEGGGGVGACSFGRKIGIKFFLDRARRRAQQRAPAAPAMRPEAGTSVRDRDPPV